MENARQIERTKTRKNAAIRYGHRATQMNCTVVDISTKGACLQVPTALGLPREFLLSFDSFRSIRRCALVWRARDKVGVSFVGAVEIPAGSDAEMDVANDD